MRGRKAEGPRLEPGAPIPTPPADLERGSYRASYRMGLDHGAHVPQDIGIDVGALTQRDRHADLAGERQVREPGDGLDDEGRRLDVPVPLGIPTSQQDRDVRTHLVRDRAPLLGKDQHLTGTREVFDGEARELRARAFADLFLDGGDDDAQRDRLAGPGSELGDGMRREQLALQLIRFERMAGDVESENLLFFRETLRFGPGGDVGKTLSARRAFGAGRQLS